MPRRKGKVVIAKGRQDGIDVTVTMGDEEAHRQMARAKGGRRVQELGTGYRWTPAEARAAARKLWDRVYPRKGFSSRRKADGTQETYRPGWPAKRAPRRSRAAWRAYYAAHPTNCIWYEPTTREWWTEDSLLYPPHRLSERTALRRLGHLSYPRKGLVPDTTIPVDSTKRAGQKDT